MQTDLTDLMRLVLAIRSRKQFTFYERKAWQRLHRSSEEYEFSEDSDKHLKRYDSVIKKYSHREIKKQLRQKIIVSMTSWPKRINDVSKALETLLVQTLPADSIILWLADSEFPNGLDDLPSSLRDLIDRGQITVRWCENVKPHKKYLFALKEFRNDIVITVDDDLYFPNDLIETLFLSYLEYPHAVSACRNHWIIFDEDGHFASYSKWPREVNLVIQKPNMHLFSTNGAGTLFPPNCVKEDLLNADLVMRLCPIADDLWVKTMLVLSDVPVVYSTREAQLSRAISPPLTVV